MRSLIAPNIRKERISFLIFSTKLSTFYEVLIVIFLFLLFKHYVLLSSWGKYDPLPTVHVVGFTEYTLTIGTKSTQSTFLLINELLFANLIQIYKVWVHDISLGSDFVHLSLTYQGSVSVALSFNGFVNEMFALLHLTHIM